ncbi:hypothetical protein KUTeg_023837 [Tegillarca granosa]|uniref:ETS domain-containing protein n=1 Tax=Tegillarca granosa TaxID=220873 RepID=A0ABQ9E7B6_TEGGR|nr:hypothetical protein KUTeg_023837 [Tegillarca granosa]
MYIIALSVYPIVAVAVAVAVVVVVSFDDSTFVPWDLLNVFDTYTPIEFASINNDDLEVEPSLFDDYHDGFYSHSLETPIINRDSRFLENKKIKIPENQEFGVPEKQKFEFIDRYIAYKNSYCNATSVTSDHDINTDDNLKILLEPLSGHPDAIPNTTKDENMSCEKESQKITTQFFDVQQIHPNSHSLHFNNDEAFQSFSKTLNTFDNQSHKCLGSEDCKDNLNFGHGHTDEKTNCQEKMNYEYICENLNFEGIQDEKDKYILDVLLNNSITDRDHYLATSFLNVAFGLETVEDNDNDHCLKEATLDNEKMNVEHIPDNLQKPLGKNSRNNSNEKKQQLQLWQFIMKVLSDTETENKCIQWVEEEDGIFEFKNPKQAASLWGETKSNKNMTYEKISRCLRNYYPKPDATSSVKREGKIKKPQKNTRKSQKLMYKFTDRFMETYKKKFKTGACTSKIQNFQ